MYGRIQRSLIGTASDLIIKAFENLLAARLVSDLTLPDPDNLPSCKAQLNITPVVAGDIEVYLLPPEILIGLRQSIVFAPFMSVPETSVDKDDSLVLPKHDVGTTGQLAAADTIAQPL